MSKLNSDIRAIAFYLPQYHPIPENDEWWGKGFTEWTNVTKAKPLFKDHYQPHLPADLGFYDLRLPETRQGQADLAREYGIHGFCYYHYWFNGKRLLERPFNEVLESGKPDFPFCLCWANENWTRRWDGQDQEILAEQVYGEESDRLHMQWLVKAFQDPRYIRIDGKPLFLVYRTTKIPNPKQTTEIWREEARRLGVGELFLCRVESFAHEHQDPTAVGFDAAVEFQPDWSNLPSPVQGRLRRWLKRLKLIKANQPNYYDYSQMVERMLQKPSPGYLRFPCVTPSWDNTARRKQGATIFHGSTPEKYELWLRSVLQETVTNPSQKGIVFINAWNEWAEGNHLEPCQRWGHGYLEATRRALKYIS
ncbi:glycoside hydrolase family 99-like domain-containing protein [Umezakia ovalisporum]|jgi:lipopolysaccharide biosynthesis protein|uniref:Glycoside hydrolase family 99-like domain-containing protein n=2 Tax=Umezakia ovalisporum TaxID=75695 RepID=A0ABT6K7Q9_9CYAN|nr:glycoside hydrolase family 99-like domain-containing protein [Umezakia ovalisporum]MDH6058050.1 glycoside hydrolase family 99-like domain-containing protein [Umezakia ovalisporum FSS-43]MDH6071539.1 glycoside hydrolase family 99-like domain-containing protein [Umezakia ovalisporum CobakiLakeA]MDH6076683.1 glycoside hydrolase family 99-like domain-containing protein [Umezakia ovalisporum FSS-45]MDH6080879.1 glycoside hydrolase family 99-like domain-containing protein [Umezakia ovalisporum FSS